MVTEPMQRAENPYSDFKGDAVNKEGRVSSPGAQYAIASSEGVNIREKPDGGLPSIGKVVYNSRIQVVCLDTTGQFYYIVPMQGGPTGWVNRSFVAMDAPDFLADLHNIQEPDLTTILKKHYVDSGLWTLGTGNDYTTLAAAVQIANNGRIGVSVDWKKVEAYKDNHTLKSTLDPWMIDNFAIYNSSDVVQGMNIWMPSVSYVKGLQDSGVIGSRPDWLNTAIDVGKGIAGFVSGVQVGLFEGLWEMVEGLWEIGKMIVNTVKGILDGSFFSSIQSIYDQLTNMSVDDVMELVDTVVTMIQAGWSDFKESWGHPNMFDRWHFRGRIIGQVVLEVVLAIFSGGATLGAKVLAKVAAKFPKLARVLMGLLKAADKITPGGHKKPDGPDLPNRSRRDGPDNDTDGGKKRDRDDEDMSKDDRAWEQTRAFAAVVTEGHDAKDTPVEELIALLNAQFAARSTVVSGYKPQANGDGSYQILQLTKRKKTVDKHYTGSNERRGVEDHEESGGHTIERHVGKSDDWLRKRLESDPSFEVVSTFHNATAANRAQGRFVKRCKKQIADYLNSGSGQPLKIDFDMGEPIGRYMTEDKIDVSRATSKVRILIRKNPNVPQGWDIITAFPIP